MDTISRLHKAIDYLKSNGRIRIQRDIVSDINGNEANVSQALKGKPRYMTDNFLKRFASVYSDYIDEHWLLTGEGRMEVPNKNLKPHFLSKASAGFMSGMSEGEYADDLRPVIVGVPDYDFSIQADGNSMFPYIEDGDVLLCRFSIDRQNPPLDKVCVIDSLEGAAVKEIIEANSHSFTLHSINPDYEDYKIDSSSVLNIAQVVGLLRNI